MTYLYLDIETEKFFGDPDLATLPRELQAAMIPLGLAMTCVDGLDWQRWTNPSALWNFMTDPDAPVVVVGWNIAAFDLPVIWHTMRQHIATWTPGPELSRKPDPRRWPKTIDLMEVIKQATGRWYKLQEVSLATIGRGKTADGKQAAQWLRAGEIERVAAYCQEDVELVRDLHQHALAGNPLELPPQQKYKQEHAIRLWLDQAGQWDRYEVRR